MLNNTYHKKSKVGVLRVFFCSDWLSSLVSLLAKKVSMYKIEIFEAFFFGPGGWVYGEPPFCLVLFFPFFSFLDPGFVVGIERGVI